jgi:hypothetical protein
MVFARRVSLFAFSAAAMLGPALAADSVLVVDRGLPQINLNNSSGTVRSNVRWSWQDYGFLGDDFTIGAPGERWVIDTIRTWAVPGGAEANLQHLGDFFQDVRLHFGASDVTPVATAQLSPGSEQTSNADVRVSDASAAGALLYDDFGTRLRVWQIDFGNLNLTVEGGTKYRFGVWGMGRPKPGTEGKAFTWYNHASNAAFSGNRQEGADGVMLLFDAAGRSEGTFNGEGNGWDKPSDINVQVFAHRVDN